jgi:hypothetical protein
MLFGLNRLSKRDRRAIAEAWTAVALWFAPLAAHGGEPTAHRRLSFEMSGLPDKTR